MFSFHPERVGHVCCLTPALRAQLSAAQIPIELCLSSNVITQSVPGYSEHHFRGFYLEGVPAGSSSDALPLTHCPCEKTSCACQKVCLMGLAPEAARCMAAICPQPLLPLLPQDMTCHDVQVLVRWLFARMTAACLKQAYPENSPLQLVAFILTMLSCMLWLAEH